jgi:hypothetical protein
MDSYDALAIGHKHFLNNVITRLVSGSDPHEELVQVYSLRALLLEEDREVSAALLNTVLFHLKCQGTCRENWVLHNQMMAIQGMNKAILRLNMIVGEKEKGNEP